MKLARFRKHGRVHHARRQNDHLVDEAGRTHDPNGVEFMLPFEPGKVLGLALNYRDHADELSIDLPDHPVLFLKPPSALIPHGAPVMYPDGADYMHYECELAVVVGHPMKAVRADEAMDYVLGYTIANDVTVRDFVGNMYRPPIKAKGWDSFGPMGPFLVTADEIPDPHQLELRAYVNGDHRQTGHTRDFIFPISEILEYVTRFMTLEPYDVILTGTPKGISRVHPEDTMRLEIDGLGALENPIVAEADY